MIGSTPRINSPIVAWYKFVPDAQAFANNLSTEAASDGLIPWVQSRNSRIADPRAFAIAI